MTDAAIQSAINMDAIIQRIFELRGQRVMLDSDLAELYGVETGALVSPDISRERYRRNP